MVLKEPVPFTITIPMSGGLNEDLDPSEIEDHELQSVTDARFDEGIMEKIPAWEKINAADQLESGATIDGCWRSYSDEGTARLIAVCNGKVYESSDWTTAIYTGLTAGKRCTFENYRGMTIISNGSDTPKVYNPKTNKVIGNIVIQGPDQIKKIAYFETDESWSGGTADTETHVYDELSGDSMQGRKLAPTAGNTSSMEWGSLSLDLSQYGDGKTADGWDIIEIWIFHRIWANVKEIIMTFETSVGNDYSFTFDNTLLDVGDDGISLERDNQWTNLKALVNRFTATGTPNWNNITKIKLSVEAESSGTASVTFDHWRMRRTPPIAGGFRIDIGTFEASEETWTGGSLDFLNFKIGEGSYGGCTALKLVNGDATSYCSKTLDLTKWLNGDAVSGCDEIIMWAKLNDSTDFTDITIKLGDAGLTNYYYKTWNSFDSGTNIWNELKCAINDFTTVGSPDWSAIARIQIETTVGVSGIAYFDHVALVLKNEQVTISDVEPGTVGETWTFPNGGVQLSTSYKSRGAYSLRGTTSKYYINTPCSMQVVFDTEVDLAQWTDGLPSGDDDIIAFWFFALYWIYGIAEIGIYLDCNTGDFSTDFFYKYISPQDFVLWLMGAMVSGDPTMRYAKSGFTRYGASGGKNWSTIKGVKLEFYTAPSHPTDPAPTSYFWVDDIHMERAATNSFSGKYRWKTVFKYGDLRSPASEATEWLELTHEIAMLIKVPTSADSRVTQREIYRQAYEDYGQPEEETFYLAGTIYDNSTTTWIDDIFEPGLSLKEMGVPEGTVEAPKGVVVTQFKDQIILLQILDALKSIKYSDFANIYAWSDLNGRDFPTEVVGGKTHFDNFFVYCRDGHVHQIADDIAEGGAAPLGSIVKCVSPWGVTRVNEIMAIVTEDNIVLFDGYISKKIGTPISPYLDMDTYKTEEAILFYHQDHLYYAVEKRSPTTYMFFDCYIPTGVWSKLTMEPTYFCAYDGNGDKNEAVMGSHDGYLYKLNPTAVDKDLLFTTKDYGDVEIEGGKGYLFHDKQLDECRIILKGDSSAGSISLTFRADGADTSVTATVPLTGDVATQYHTYVVPLEGIKDSVIGQTIGLSFQHTTSAKKIYVKAILLRGKVLPLEEQFV